MAMASGNEQSKRWLAILVAYAVVLALLGGAGLAYWIDGRGGLPRVLGSERTLPAKTETAQIESTPVANGPEPSPSLVEPETTTPAKTEIAQEPAVPPPATEARNGDLVVLSTEKPELPTTGLDLPPRPVESKEAAPARMEPAQEPAVPPSPQAEANSRELAALPTKKPEPPTASCKADTRVWPADRTNQVKVVQILLRDLGFYSGTTYGTMGPATRAAIGRFQLAGNEPATGEATEMLFEALKKRCAASAQ
jgi:hypothetical protein